MYLLYHALFILSRYFFYLCMYYYTLYTCMYASLSVCVLCVYMYCLSLCVLCIHVLSLCVCMYVMCVYVLCVSLFVCCACCVSLCACVVCCAPLCACMRKSEGVRLLHTLRACDVSNQCLFFSLLECRSPGD